MSCWWIDTGQVQSLIPLCNIIGLHTCILPFLMISLANDEILQLCCQNYVLTLVSWFSIKNQGFKNSFFFKQLCCQNLVLKLTSWSPISIKKKKKKKNLIFQNSLFKVIMLPKSYLIKKIWSSKTLFSK